MTLITCLFPPAVEPIFERKEWVIQMKDFERKKKKQKKLLHAVIIVQSYVLKNSWIVHFGVKEWNPVPMVLSLHRKINKKKMIMCYAYRNLLPEKKFQLQKWNERNSKNDNDSFLSLSSSAINFHHFLIKENNSLIHWKSVKGF